MYGRHFPGNYRHFSSRRGVHDIVNLGGVVKTLRRSNSLSRSVFSTAGSFGWGGARGRPWYGTFAKPRSHFTEGMFEKRWTSVDAFVGRFMGPVLEGLKTGKSTFIGPVTPVVGALVWAMFRKPQPLQLVQKVRQYTSNLYGSTPPICIAVLSWLLSFEERQTLQYASHLYCSTPPICTAVRPPFVRQYFWKILGVGVTATFLIVGDLVGAVVAHSWAHSWCHSWTHSWVEVRFRLLCASHKIALPS